jgi:hypothetical protein
MKYLKWIVLVIVVIIVLAIGGVWLTLDGIVRSEVESQATNSLNLQTTLASANVSIFGGSLALNDLQIASPEGFGAQRMLTLGGAKVGVSISQLRADPIGIDQITIDKPVLVIEQAGGKFNFHVLMDKPSKQSSDAGQPNDGKRQAGEPIRVIVHDLTVNNPKVVIHPGIPGLKNEISLNLPSIHLQDIGTGEGNKNGVAIKQVVMQVVTAMVQKAAESDALPPEVKQLLSLNVDQIRAQLQGELTKQIGNLTKGAGKNLSGDSIEKGLGGLLKQNKKDKSPDNQ